MNEITALLSQYALFSWQACLHNKRYAAHTIYVTFSILVDSIPKMPNTVHTFQGDCRIINCFPIMRILVTNILNSFCLNLTSKHTAGSRTSNNASCPATVTGGVTPPSLPRLVGSPVANEELTADSEPVTARQPQVCGESTVVGAVPATNSLNWPAH